MCPPFNWQYINADLVKSPHCKPESYPMVFANCWFNPPRLPTEDELKDYDGLEIHPCANVSEDPNWSPVYEQCEPDDADIWSVFMHHKQGGLESLTDLATKEGAEAVAERLSELWNMEIKTK